MVRQGRQAAQFPVETVDLLERAISSLDIAAGVAIKCLRLDRGSRLFESDLTGPIMALKAI